jgi:general secretion pathway protein D
MTLRRPIIRLKYSALCALLLFAGCANESRIPPSAGHISEPAKRAASDGIPQPVPFAAQLPPPKPQAKQPTYSVVVTEVPVKELLFALARDTQLNIDVHPNIQGIVTLNAINETLPSILDRVAKQVNLRYRLEGTTLIVTPDTPYLKAYKVDYVNLTRKTSSSIGVSTQVATTGSGAAVGGATGASGTTAGSNSSVTNVTSASNNEFWEVLAANVRDIIKSTRAISQSAEERNARVEAARAAREDRLQQATAVARAGQAAPNLFSAVFGAGAQTQLDEKKDDVIVNPVTGSVMVMATEAQHKHVQQYLDRLQTAANRQVLIEATIVAVQLKDEFKAGVDWKRAVGSGTGFYFNTTPNLANALSSFATVTYFNANDNFAAAIQLLESFGNTRVLSSPKLMVLNNQTSILKVVDNLVYFTIEVQQGTTSSTGIVTQPTYTTTANTVPVGVVMSVTPQINDNGRVTLVVRPTISRKVGEVLDPNPALNQGSNPIENKVPVIQVSEMESVLQVPSGETVVLGGLMQDDSARNSDTLPGFTDTPLNYLFGQKERKVAQTELVIFIRPTYIPNPSLSSDELSFYRRYLPPAPDAAAAKPAP